MGADAHTGTVHYNSEVANFDVERVRADFPILESEINGHPLVYFDNAATAQKPVQVIRTVTEFYESLNSNVHRGVHTLSQRATDAYESARTTAARFLNAPSDREVIFTTGTTEGVNIVAFAFSESFLSEGDEVIVTEIEHHSNFVPWQRACQRAGAHLRVLRADASGRISLDELAKLISGRTRLIAITHVSNTLGTVVDLERVIDMAHDRSIPVFADGAQAAPHQSIDVQELDVDFYAFSGHKVFGPMGIGVLYGKAYWLDQFSPLMTGGGMIDLVTADGTTWADLPHKLEAGTPNVAGAVGLAAAIDYVMAMGLDTIAQYETDLSSYLEGRIEAMDGVEVLGPAENRAAVFSVKVGSAHPFDVGSLLDQMGIAVRTGHHCNQPLMARLGVPGTVRASLAFYNTRQEIDRFVEALDRIKTMVA